VVGFLWELPFCPGKQFLNHGGFAGRRFGGWQLSGIMTPSTGRPYNVSRNTGVNNGATSWPDRIAKGRLAHPDPYYWFNDKDFVAPPVNTFRLDAFNLFNTPGFGFPNANIGSPTVGRITSTNSDSRDLQFALKVEF